MTPVHATTLDATTMSLGLHPSSALRVRSVHRAAINLVGDAGSLVTIADARVGGLPGGILVPSADLRSVGVRPGMTGYLSVDRCEIDPAGLTVRLGDAIRWDPNIPRADPAPWPTRSRQVRALAWALLADGSIGRVPDGAAALDDVGTAIRDADANAVTAAAGRLVGRGPGLTPSGDDALTGIVAVLHATGHPSLPALVAALHDLDGRTTFVGAAMLRHAAAGAFGERIHRLMRSLLVRDPRDGEFEAAVRATVAWGATSGSDLVAGVLVGLDAVAGLGRRPIGEVAA